MEAGIFAAAVLAAGLAMASGIWVAIELARELMHSE